MIQGVVPNCLSSSNPPIVKPILGTNSRHVVFAMVRNNKMTVEESGGTFFSSPLFGDVLMYVYTITAERPFAKIMPRQNHTPPHRPFQFTSSCQQKRRFATERQALEAADYQMLVKPGLELAVYKCPDCHGWHLTRRTRTDER
jgi:hypothetical protein